MFLGPTPLTMRQFGLKHEARQLAISANVRVPPTTTARQDLMQDYLPTRLQCVPSISFRCPWFLVRSYSSRWQPQSTLLAGWVIPYARSYGPPIAQLHRSHAYSPCS